MKIYFITYGGRLGLVLLLGCLGLGCAPRTVVFTRSQLLMGHIPVNISLRTERDGLQRASEAADQAFALARSLEAKLSEYRPDSDISCLNRRAGSGYCRLSPETVEFLQVAMRYGRATDYAFDLRFASLSPAGREGAILFRGDREAKLAHPDTRLGVGAIGKGFIVDRMLPVLRAAGFPVALVDAGGHLRASGGPWKVAIQVPGALPGQITEEREIADQSWSTSGLYEQGRHVVDPRSMEKIDRVDSVTVIAPDLTQADALDTAFLVMGKEKAAEYLPRFPDIEVLWLSPPGNSGLSPPD